MMSLALISQTDVGPRTPTHVVELAGLTTAPGRSMLSDFEQHLGGKGGSAIKPKFERKHELSTALGRTFQSFRARHFLDAKALLSLGPPLPRMSSL